ncbi:hypothetical protein [Pseudoclavibacter sp. RFBA6]|uniref:hypothetical protein n=1 Tax=Pseudoclavibacter sp. RFBA6 TaxID=2080573 RepID=UPI000CE7D9D4|nr:hypothetical protein [Pseudoclavibacter sp. RFBA6]PPG43100.1 hypothetical protein C5C17_00550 [Pseudoclavibacter sp. RFBA6]
MDTNDRRTPAEASTQQAGDDDRALAPSEMLALMRDQQRTTRTRLDRALYILLGTWAVAWLVGFQALWSAEDGGGSPLVRIPTVTAFVVFGALMVVGVIVSVICGVSMGRGMRGRSNTAGTLYGFSWSISMMGAWFFAASLLRQVEDPALAPLLMPGIFAMTIGVLYMAGAAMSRSGSQFALGVAVVALAVVATAFGAPTHYLIYSTAGPLIFLTFIVLLRTGAISSDPGQREPVGQGEVHA